MDTTELNKELDRTKARIFIGNNAAFLGSLMCSMQFIWDDTVETAATDGVNIWWNPEHFMGLSKEQRVTVLVHEVWHPARLHFHRKGNRDPEIWNHACDYIINNEMERAGFIFNGIGLIDHDFDGMCEEDVYDILMQQQCNMPSPPAPSPFNDMREPSKEVLQDTVNNVVRSIHEATLAGMAGTIPGATTEIIKAYLDPVVPWEILLDRFMQELLEEDYSWSHPNRRYPDMYLPHRYEVEGKLQKLNYYLDVSGSISSKDILRFNSEIKFIKERYNPTELNLIQFDTRICKETVIRDNDQFTELEAFRGGGTSLVPVRWHILENKPTAAIIFTDLQCDPMESLPFDIPIIWVAIGSGQKPLFGEYIRIRDKK